MFTLSQMPDIRKTGKEILNMRGINYSDQTADGDLADSMNVSARRYPYLATRRKREKQSGYQNASAMTAWDKLVVVEGRTLKVGDQTASGELADITDVRQFVAVNTKLVIWPDKLYCDLNTLTIKPMGAEVEATGATFAAGNDTTQASVTLTGISVDLTTLFQPGDGLEISGCTSKTENNKTFVVKKVEAGKLYATAKTFVAATETGTIKAMRKIPDMDYICESENRLWGCSSEKQTLYASANGDPTNFNVFENLATDSYAVAVGTPGEFTGCCKLSSSVLFWKENVLHKMLGSFPAEYQLYQYTVEGLRKGCSKSMQVINETLFYMGLHGVFAFAGGTPSLISPNFGERTFTDAVGGNDGDTYYLSCKEGDEWHLFAYETRENLWVHEDRLHVIDFARLGKDLFLLDAVGNVWLETGTEDNPNMEWMVQYAPFYEVTRPANKAPVGTLERKKYSKITLRLELPVKSWVCVSVRADNGPWREIGRVIGTTCNTARIRIPLTRCDKFEIRLNGKGPCAILDLKREYALGSEV